MTINACLEVLGITGKPTKTAVKKAFRQAALKYHPDKRGTDSKIHTSKNCLRRAHGASSR